MGWAVAVTFSLISYCKYNYNIAICNGATIEALKMALFYGKTLRYVLSYLKSEPKSGE